MTDWDAVREHLAIVMEWHRGDGSGENWRFPLTYFDALGVRRERVCDWKPDKHADQFFALKDAMRKRGYFWHGWEDESGANVQYWKPGEFHVEYGEDLMQANALAAAEVYGYEQE